MVNLITAPAVVTMEDVKNHSHVYGTCRDLFIWCCTTFVVDFNPEGIVGSVLYDTRPQLITDSDPEPAFVNYRGTWKTDAWLHESEVFHLAFLEARAKGDQLVDWVKVCKQLWGATLDSERGHREIIFPRDTSDDQSSDVRVVVNFSTGKCEFRSGF